MSNQYLVLKTGIEINFTEYKKLMREVIDAKPSKGMSITIKEIKDKQKSILKDVKLANELYLKEAENRMIDQKKVDLFMKIVDRAWEKMKDNYKDKLDMMLDLEFANRDCPLRLQELLDADDLNFYHDLVGIGNNLNRQTHKLENYFVPRYAKPDKNAERYGIHCKPYDD